ncbi:Na+-translocating ferredoxin:NAD+ oxidoreductase RnfC subunit [Enterococcus sp. PF1-24]|uniref:4Fe-4S dicluster domain-containing protein n=1 Tax=unclassified Enterococcus TaxID=2608891 RepID=UPI00247370B9|nr:MULTISPECIES: 4Fe-4S dicluster domain-containing protein [unclassified Enterococcus]MDH6365604.1 Na+-translocating ferredoxin:NAD+ oxidoreductase RnfC subunit [Enterococcus sp. PFB1-1]MDH6402706.1 Na+-translocating ferredoxin:NAD+ oxidoreductase RnfC subunit [Enterococcus sp. PF1-24]
MLLEQIANAGIVGCGGAGFPTAAKYQTQAEYFIINAAECEPLLKTDHYIMNHYAKECVQAIAEVGALLQAQHIVIATKAYYTKEINALENAIAELKVPVSVFKMENFYPAGDEQTMVFEVTGRTVPPAGIPINVGCVVSNIATMLNVYQAKSGNKVTRKFLTITGAVKEPKILDVPIGTSFAECLALAGGATIDDFMFINGGPMMGRVGTMADFAEQVVTKTTSGIIITEKRDFIYELFEKDMGQVITKARSSCIQCRLCTELCPRYQIGHPIHPHRVMRHLAITDPAEIDDDPIWQEALLCCECGICEVVACPMGLMPRQVNKFVKQRLAEKGVRYQRKENLELTVSTMRDYQKVPPKKIILKDGLKEYVDLKVENCVAYEPASVKIPLKMHIGAPTEAVVQIGDTIQIGDLIGQKPETALGANIHASINGIVTAIAPDSITIERKAG